MLAFIISGSLFLSVKGQTAWKKFGSPWKTWEFLFSKSLNYFLSRGSVTVCVVFLWEVLMAKVQKYDPLQYFPLWIQLWKLVLLDDNCPGVIHIPGPAKLWMCPWRFSGSHMEINFPCSVFCYLISCGTYYYYFKVSFNYVYISLCRVY